MQKPNDLGKYSEEELEVMDIRDLDAHAEAWIRIFSVRDAEEWERDYSRLATRIFIKRREVLRKAAPELLEVAQIAYAMLRRPDSERDENRVVNLLLSVISKAGGMTKNRRM